jgi:RNA polymerase sigma-70 factor (ECF subfamily)
VTDEIGKMPPRMKEVYLLKKEDNLSIQEIAGKLQISEQTIKNQLQQAYTRLRTRLKDHRLPLFFIGLALYQ